MADINYPQRWLREAEAVTSPEGWRKQVTNELLKCQKGLEETPIETVPTLNTVSISGVPTTTTIVVDGETSFTFDYSFVDATYVPVNVECVATTDGAGRVTATKVDGSNKFKVVIVGGSATEKVSVKVVIDTVSSVSRSSTLQD